MADANKNDGGMCLGCALMTAFWLTCIVTVVNYSGDYERVPGEVVALSFSEGGAPDSGGNDIGFFRAKGLALVRVEFGMATVRVPWDEWARLKVGQKIEVDARRGRWFGNFSLYWPKKE